MLKGLQQEAAECALFVEGVKMLARDEQVLTDADGRLLFDRKKHYRQSEARKKYVRCSM